MSWTEEEDKAAKQNQPTVNAEGDSKQNSIDANNEIWALLEKTLLENMVEKRRARRWKIFFRFTTLAILVGILVAWFTRSELSEMQIQGDTVAIIPMQGVIGSDADIESSEMVSLLDSAYSNNQLKGVIIEMNSPGGSPVHSGIIYDAIRNKQAVYPDIPILVVVEDMAASGGYYIASAASEIYANQASLVGSIGVISSGFEASELLEKIGVERRVFTAGRNKAFLDPFTPMSEEAEEKWQSVLDETHQQFIDAVKAGRKDRLTVTDDVFSGMIFTGTQAEKIGLIDGLASINQLLETRFPNARPILFEPKEEPLKELAKELGVEFAVKALSQYQWQ
ncbi:signal peptide peptidase SppA [Marinomonas aquiplantarum]|uniref:Protease-4 n=1 Tax=Marinomonas aquiplantarum TaxID=491951 RepID=A0A366CYY7_9GAMM|nr:signal peptide peptidase SppA [Marinomonas aquiplantarum]RBO82906.1 protease-4 [Marinomonas aquiplantarum]